jgi:hypothetical protein
MQREDNLQRERETGEPPSRQKLLVTQTATGYWVVQRGDIQLAGAISRRAAERERERMVRLARRGGRRSVARV